jgi:hypothetical protein
MTVNNPNYYIEKLGPVITCLALLAHPAVAQTLEPSASDITDALTATLPSWWRVETATIVAKVNDGDAITPLWRFRAEADARLESPIYAADPAATRVPGPFVVVTETMAADTSRKVFAVGSAEYSTGEWNIDLTVENTFDGLGRPADFFNGPVLVPGTPEADATLARLDAGRALAERLRADSQSRQAVFSEAMAELDAALERAAAEQTNRIEQTLAEMRSRLANAQLSFDTEMNTARSDLETRIAAAERELAALADGGLEAARVAAETRAAGIEAAALAELATALEKVAGQRLAIARGAAEQAAAVAAAEADALRAASEAKQVLLAALRNTLSSEDPGMRRTAFAEALQSGEWVLQREALSMLIAEAPTLTIRFSRADAYDGKTLPESNAYIVKAFDATTGNFEGERRWHNGGTGMRGTIGQGGLSVQDQWCQATLTIEGTQLEGPLTCGNDKWYGLIELY